MKNPNCLQILLFLRVSEILLHDIRQITVGYHYNRILAFDQHKCHHINATDSSFRCVFFSLRMILFPIFHYYYFYLIYFACADWRRSLTGSLVVVRIDVTNTLTQFLIRINTGLMAKIIWILNVLWCHSNAGHFYILFAGSSVLFNFLYRSWIISISFWAFHVLMMFFFISQYFCHYQFCFLFY